MIISSNLGVEGGTSISDESNPFLELPLLIRFTQKAHRLSVQKRMSYLRSETNGYDGSNLKRTFSPDGLDFSPQLPASQISVMMEPPTSNDVELPPVQNLNQTARRLSAPHYVISPQDVTVDRNAPLQTTGRSGNVFKGSWSNGVVAVKILSNDMPADVSQILLYQEHTNRYHDQIVDLVRPC